MGQLELRWRWRVPGWLQRFAEIGRAPSDSEELRVRKTVLTLSSTLMASLLAAAGHKRRKRHVGPAGLTPREVEVLTFIARGASNRQVAHA